MKIIKDSNILDLQSDAILEVENSSPVFNDLGSQSVAITLPATNDNRKNLGYPDRLDKRDKLAQKERVSVQDGALERYGILNIISADERGIQVNIGFDESEAYAKMGNVKLKDIPGLPVFSIDGDNRVTEMLDHLTAVLKYEIDTDYFMFQVVTSYEEEEIEQGGQKVIKKYYMQLNETKLGFEGIAELLAYSERKKEVKINGETVMMDFPVGYGVSPFLKLHVLLRLIWEYLGFTIIENPFSDHFQLKKLCVMNNSFDTIVKGSIDYKHLMPDASIEDILQTIWCRFGARSFVDSNTKTVRIKFIRDILNSPDSIDFSIKKSVWPKVSMSNYKQLRLSAGNSFEKTKTDMDTYEEFLAESNNVVNELDNEMFLGTVGDFGVKGGDLIMNRLTGEYWKRNIFSKKYSYKSSSFFIYDKKDDVEYLELKSPDEQMSQLFPNNMVPSPFFDCGERHFNTTLQLKSKADTKEENKDCAVALCFAIGYVKTYECYFGSQLGWSGTGNSRYVDDDGNKYTIDLLYHGKYGLFHQFFKEFDAFNRHANQIVTQSFELSKTVLGQFDFSKKIMVDSQLYLPDIFNQKFGNTADSVEIKLRSLRLLEPYDLDKEQSIPVTDKQIYFWDYFNDIEIAIATERDKLIQNLKENNPNLTIEYHSESNRNIISQPVGTEYDHLIPPGEIDYINKVEHTRKYDVASTFAFLVISAIGPTVQGFTRQIKYKAGVRVMPIR